MKKHLIGKNFILVLSAVAMLLGATFGASFLRAEGKERKVLLLARAAAASDLHSIMEAASTPDSPVTVTQSSSFSMLGGSLSEYSLIFIMMPDTSLVSYADNLSNYANAGGCVVLCGEFGGPNRATNLILTELAQAMGTDFEISPDLEIKNGAYGGLYYGDLNMDSELANGITSGHVNIAASGVLVGLPENAQIVATATTDQEYVIAADLKVRNGYLTVFADTNIFDRDRNNVRLCHNLLTRSVEQIEEFSHSWNYESGEGEDANKIYAYCTQEHTCDYHRDNKLVLSLEANDLLYNMAPYENYHIDDRITGVTKATLEISYYTDEDLNNPTTSVNGATTEGGAPTEIGDYWMKVSVIEDATVKASASAGFAIIPDVLYVRDKDVNVVYDGDPHTISIRVVNPVAYEITYGYEEGTYDMTEAPTQTDVGSKTIYYRVTAQNYEDVYGVATVTVTPKTPEYEIQLNPDVEYDKDEHWMETHSEITGGSIYFRIGADGEWKTSRPGATDAGDYEVYYKIIGEPNYSDVEETRLGTFKILPREIELVWSDFEFSYDRNYHKPTVRADGVLPGDSCDVIVTGDAKNAGSYEAVATIQAGSNYCFNGENTHGYVIHPKEVTIVVDDVQKHAGEEEPTYTFYASGIIPGDTIFGIHMTREQGEEVGSYAVTAGEENGANPNYSLQFVDGTLTITDHVYSNPPTFTWNEELTECMARFICDYNSSHVLDEPCEITVTGDDSAKTYVASVTKNGKTYTDTVYVYNHLKNDNRDSDGREFESRVLIRYHIGENEIEETIRNLGYTNEQRLQDEMMRQLMRDEPKWNAPAGITVKQKMYSVIMQITYDGGQTWERATREHFPADGISISLPYPKGTNAKDHNFAVSHMFAEEMGMHEPGETELPEVQETEEGLVVTATSLSPVMIAWTDAVVSIELNKKEIRFDRTKGEEKLIATVLPQSAMEKGVIWTTSNAKVAQVTEDGTVVAVGTGECMITATTRDGGKTASCKIVVAEVINRAHNVRFVPDTGDVKPFGLFLPMAVAWLLLISMKQKNK